MHSGICSPVSQSIWMWVNKPIVPVNPGVIWSLGMEWLFPIIILQCIIFTFNIQHLLLPKINPWSYCCCCCWGSVLLLMECSDLWWTAAFGQCFLKNAGMELGFSKKKIHVNTKKRSICGNVKAMPFWLGQTLLGVIIFSGICQCCKTNKHLELAFCFNKIRFLWFLSKLILNWKKSNTM